MAEIPSTEFKVQETDIPGLLVFDVNTISDERGFFQEKFQKAKEAQLGLPEDFAPVQHNISFNKDIGVVRGIHAEPWNKYISVVTGRIFCAFVDLREGESFGKVVQIELDPTKAVYLPKGCGNSFMTLEPTYYSYIVDAHWKPDQYDQYTFVNLADPELGIDWPIPLSEATMSDKDKNHPYLKDLNK
ncbi:MAG TPA: dTDP-4-dehydrorhamnose 3,5-epimerase family protein [Candidatus Saccharimonadales bacterium]|nr:dTDP-4-dehydrorhamnose 3,5-epimerase family protein [Candidatus Saccharimonadales bacterium]